MVTEFILLAFSELQRLQILLFIFILLSFITCFMGNSAILVLVKYEHSLHTPMYFFLSNFALLEIIFVSITVPKLLANLIVASRTISFIGCFAQMFAFNFIGIAECYFLAVMAIDRDLAINIPLNYSSIMSTVRCTKLSASSWIFGFVIATTPVIFTAKLEYCGPNEVNHFFCDFAPLQRIACSNPLVSSLITSVAGMCASLIPFLVILGCYTHIIVTISRIKSAAGKWKAFSTCSSHLIVASLFYSSANAVYLIPQGSEHDKFLALMYAVFVPSLNPFIYTLRNKDIKAAIRKSKLLRVIGQIKGNMSQFFW